jgi:hypothetical protein
MKKLILTLAVAALGSAVCFAGTKTVKLGKDKTVAPVEELFRANEFDVSIYGAVAVGRVDHYNTSTFLGDAGTDTTKHYTHNAWGGGVEADYFFTRYFGLGVEGDWLAGHDCISSVSGNLIGRYPFEYGTWGWAPYGFIGGGGQFDSQNAGYGQIGAGAEVRFKGHWGIFSDARWVAHDVFIDYALIRAGIRFNF